MLIFTLGVGESLRIGEGTTLSVLDIRNREVALKIVAPESEHVAPVKSPVLRVVDSAFEDSDLESSH